MSIADLKSFVLKDAFRAAPPSYNDIKVACLNFDKLCKLGLELVVARGAEGAKTEYEARVTALRHEFTGLAGNVDGGDYCHLYVETHKRARKELLQLICSLAHVKETVYA